MSWSNENDGEAALFQSKMEEDDTCQRLLRNGNLRRLARNEPYPVEINSETLRALVKQHNGALQLLREIVEAYPEDTAMMGRAHAFMKEVGGRATVDL